MYQDYIEMYPDKTNRISLGSFAKLVKVLTTFDQKGLKVVDYTSGILLYDSIALMREIVNKMTNHFAYMASHKMPMKLEHFLKYDYVAHRSNNPSATSHDILHGLGHKVSSDTFNACQLPFQVVFFVKRSAAPDLHHLVNNCAENSSCSWLT
jgi:hypothetical protein